MKPILSALFCLFLLNSCNVPDQEFKTDHPFYSLANPHLDEAAMQSIGKQMKRHLVKVAVIDGGIDYLHPRLAKNLRFNSHFEGIGLDITGRDFYPYYSLIDRDTGSDMSELYDIKEHGTHVSSLALLGGYVQRPDGSKVNASDAMGLIPIRAIPFSEKDFSDDIPMDDLILAALANEKQMVEILIKNMTTAINFAKKEGAFVVNMSLGAMAENLNELARNHYDETIANQFMPMMKNEWKDMLIVIAAGNDSVDITTSHVFPASLGLENGIVVGALDESGGRADYSNFGRGVEVFVRGSDIKASVPGGSSEKLSGTSMAAPLIANLAAKIKLTAPCLSAAEVKKIILSSAKDQVASFKSSLTVAQGLCR